MLHFDCEKSRPVVYMKLVYRLSTVFVDRSRNPPQFTAIYMQLARILPLDKCASTRLEPLEYASAFLLNRM